MIKLSKIIFCGGAAPYELTAITECGKDFYLRYRNGRLRWGFVKKRDIIPSKWEFDQKIGGDLDWEVDDILFKSHLEKQIEFPKGFKF